MNPTTKTLCKRLRQRWTPALIGLLIGASLVSLLFFAVGPRLAMWSVTIESSLEERKKNDIDAS